MSVIAGPNIITNGLILTYDAGSIRSYIGTGTSWLDLTPYEYNGTLVNGPTFSTDNNGYFTFDYTNDHVTTISMENYVYSDGITVGVWHYNGGGTGSYRGVVTNGTTDDRVGGFDLRYGRENYFGGTNNGTSLNWAIRNNSNTAASVTINANVNEWHYYVGTYDNTTVRGYKDGSLFASSALSGGGVLKSKSASTTIGLSPGTSEYLDGRLAYVQIYNRSLSESEILNNFNVMKKRFG
jgi:hypothetical protein